MYRMSNMDVYSVEQCSKLVKIYFRWLSFCFICLMSGGNFIILCDRESVLIYVEADCLVTRED